MIRVITGPRRGQASRFPRINALKESDFGYTNFDDEKLAETKDYDDILNAINQEHTATEIYFL